MSERDREQLPKKVELLLEGETEKFRERQQILMNIQDRVLPRIDQTSNTAGIIHTLRMGLKYLDMVEKAEQRMADDVESEIDEWRIADMDMRLDISFEE